MSGVAASETRTDRRTIGLLAFGHLATDFCQGVVPPLLVLFVALRGYSYGQAGSLLLFSSLGSSLLQPILGFHSDRLRQATWMMPAGVALAAFGVAGSGLAPGYLGCGLLLGVASIGVAMFHPEAARRANLASGGSSRGRAMSIFALGGTSGWAIAPVIVTPVVLWLGPKGMLLVALLPAIAAVVLTAAMRTPSTAVRATSQTAAASAGEAQWGVFSLVATAATLRTGVQFGLQAFVPLYVWKLLSASHSTANLTTTALLGFGAAGTLLGGSLADRYGFRRVVVISLALVPALVGALTTTSVLGVFVLMAAIGLAMDANFYPLVVIAQEAVPRRVGFASGIVLGLSVGLGALTASLLGVFADAAGLRAALLAIAALGVLAACAAAALPLAERRVRQTAAAPQAQSV